MTLLTDLTGEFFGKWEVLRRAVPARSGNETMWLCRCTGCDLEKSVQANNLTGKRTSGCRNCRVRLPHLEASFNGLFNSYRRSAERTRRIFRLSKREFRRLTSLDCHYCGRPPSQVWKRGATNGHYTYNGIDRQNNKRGYVKGNCLPCCFRCNFLKAAAPYEDFLNWINRIAARHPRPAIQENL